MNVKKIANDVLKNTSEFYTPQQIKKWFEKLPQDEKNLILERTVIKPSESEKTILHKILQLCKKIVRYDLSFENKTHEIENAKRVAGLIQKDYDELVKLVEQVEPKDTNLVKEMLSILDHPWMLVLRDQLRDKDKLDEKLRDLSRHISLEKKEKLYQVNKQLDEISKKIKLPKTQKLDAETFHYYL